MADEAVSETVGEIRTGSSPVKRTKQYADMLEWQTSETKNLVPRGVQVRVLLSAPKQYAGMVELADTVVSKAIASACRFKSCYLHQNILTYSYKIRSTAFQTNTKMCWFFSVIRIII
jgi:hypothetical protein